MQYIIIGNGVAGVTAAQNIVKAAPDSEVHIFGAEPYVYYQRPRLWEFLAGEIAQDNLYFRPAEWYVDKGIQLHLGKRITRLSPQEHTLTLNDGSHVTYDRLLLAMGARPFVPPFEGANQEGVFTLRAIDDALAMKEYAKGLKSAIVIGCGLLGLETARAITSMGLKTSVLEVMPHVLPRQLDKEGAGVLRTQLEDMGLNIVTDAVTETILGDGRATGVRLKDGREIEGKLILVSTGIRSRIGLAQDAGLEVNRGVVVNEHLQTSAPDVYAAGDVAEFEEIVYGIIPAAIEQSIAAAANMVNDGSATYSGTLPSTTLKVVGIDLTSLGNATTTEDDFDIVRQIEPQPGVYKRLTLRDGKVVGAIMLGDAKDVRPIKQLINSERDVSVHSEKLLDEDFDLIALAQGKI